MDKIADGLCIVTTGGTFDKIYDEIRGELTFRRSHLPKILKAARCAVPVSVKRLLALDSLNMEASHRKKIAEACSKRPERRIIVTHGTDTMVETARVVAARKLDKVIVFTGAMVPFALENSDAVFNLGCAFTAVQLLGPGVYLCMSGKVFAYDQVRKNRELGIFEGFSLQSTPATAGAGDPGVKGINTPGQALENGGSASIAAPRGEA